MAFIWERQILDVAQVAKKCYNSFEKNTGKVWYWMLTFRKITMLTDIFIFLNRCKVLGGEECGLGV